MGFNPISLYAFKVSDKWNAQFDFVNILLAFFEPILRADFEINETNDFERLSPVRTPVYAIMGNKEMKVECITNWQQYTSAAFNAEVLSGDHFFIYNNAEKLASIIQSCHDKAVVCRY